MALASIQSLRNGADPITSASRDDLVLSDVVTVSSVNAGTSYAWSLAYRPEGSAAVFSSTGTTSAILRNPGTFTVDVEGSYLLRLLFTDGTGSSEQFVRLRALTSVGSLKLIAAGERYDVIPVPVDATPSGWADEQNYNLNQLLGLVGATPSTVKASFSYTDSTVVVTTLNPGDVVVQVLVRVLTEFDGAAPVLEVGTSSDPDLFLEAVDSSLLLPDTFIANPMEEAGSGEDMELILSGLTGATQGSGILVALIHRA